MYDQSFLFTGTSILANKGSGSWPKIQSYLFFSAWVVESTSPKLCWYDTGMETLTSFSKGLNCSAYGRIFVFIRLTIPNSKKWIIIVSEKKQCLLWPLVCCPYSKDSAEDNSKGFLQIGLFTALKTLCLLIAAVTGVVVAFFPESAKTKCLVV